MGATCFICEVVQNGSGTWKMNCKPTSMSRSGMINLLIRGLTKPREVLIRVNKAVYLNIRTQSTIISTPLGRLFETTARRRAMPSVIFGKE